MNIYIIYSNKVLGRFRKFILHLLGFKLVGDNQV